MVESLHCVLPAAQGVRSHSGQLAWAPAEVYLSHKLACAHSGGQAVIHTPMPTPARAKTTALMAATANRRECSARLRANATTAKIKPAASKTLARAMTAHCNPHKGCVLLPAGVISQVRKSAPRQTALNGCRGTCDRSRGHHVEDYSQWWIARPVTRSKGQQMTTTQSRCPSWV